MNVKYYPSKLIDWRQNKKKYKEIEKD